jgi:hypothetical protein
VTINYSDRFFKRAKENHNNKYDYSKSVYTGALKYITITCPIHGEFKQQAASHLNGSGCKLCANIQRKETNLEKYGGHPLQNKDVMDRLEQTCLERHGVKHPLQNKEIHNKMKQTNLERFGFENAFLNKEIQDKQRETNLERYGYESPFQNKKLQIEITQKNLEKYGGHPTQTKTVQDKRKLTCFNRYGFENAFKNKDFQIQQNLTNIERYGVTDYNQKHMVNILPLIEDYSWLFDQYITQNKTAIQISKELKISDTTLGRHLKKLEIDIKRHQWSSHSSLVWLESIMKAEAIHIQHAQNSGEYYIRGLGTCRADGYCKETNTIYEFHGDYWHGNPELFESSVYNKSTHDTMGELYQATIERENKIKSLGYNLVVMWENEWNKINKENKICQ